MNFGLERIGALYIICAFVLFLIASAVSPPKSQSLLRNNRLAQVLCVRRQPTDSHGVDRSANIFSKYTKCAVMGVWKEDEITFNIACRMVVAIFGCGAGLSLSFYRHWSVSNSSWREGLLSLGKCDRYMCQTRSNTVQLFVYQLNGMEHTLAFHRSDSHNLCIARTQAMKSFTTIKMEIIWKLKYH